MPEPEPEPVAQPEPEPAPQPLRPVQRYRPDRPVPNYNGGGSRGARDKDEDEDPDQEEDEVPAYVDPDPQDGTLKIRRRRRSGGRKSWESLVEGSVGMMAMSRRMTINYPVGVANLRNLPGFNSGILPAVRLELAVYPLVLSKRGPLANVGLVGRYWRMLGLEYQLENVEPLSATLHAFELGLRGRWNILGSAASPTLFLGLEFGRQSFVVQNDAALQRDFPNLAYVYLKLGPLALDWPVYRNGELMIGLSGSFEYLQIFSAGAISETTAAGSFGPEASQGIEFGGGIFGSYGGFFARVTGSYRRIFFSFDHACDGGCDGSAADIVAGAGLSAGFTY